MVGSVVRKTDRMSTPTKVQVSYLPLQPAACYTCFQAEGISTRVSTLVDTTDMGLTGQLTVACTRSIGTSECVLYMGCWGNQLAWDDIERRCADSPSCLERIKLKWKVSVIERVHPAAIADAFARRYLPPDLDRTHGLLSKAVKQLKQNHATVQMAQSRDQTDPLGESLRRLLARIDARILADSQQAGGVGPSVRRAPPPLPPPSEPEPESTQLTSYDTGDEHEKPPPKRRRASSPPSRPLPLVSSRVYGDVAVRGLLTRTEYNGQIGSVVSYDRIRERYLVKIPGVDNMLSLLEKNLLEHKKVTIRAMPIRAMSMLDVLASDQSDFSGCEAQIHKQDGNGRIQLKLSAFGGRIVSLTTADLELPIDARVTAKDNPFLGGRIGQVVKILAESYEVFFPPFKTFAGTTIPLRFGDVLL